MYKFISIKLKIAFIASRNISEIGGIENYMANLCPILVEKGHKIILYTEGDEHKTQKFKGVEIISYKSINNKYLNKILLGFKASFNVVFYQKNIDLIHYNAMAAGLFSFIPILFRKNVIFQMHGLEWQRQKWSKKSRFIIKVLEKFVIKINKNITAVSQEQSNYIQKEYNKNCKTIFSGANIKNIDVNTDVLKKYNLLGTKYILFLGRLVEEKRPDLLIKAFEKLENTDVKLVIAGYDKYSKNYIEYLHNLSSKNNRIILTGKVLGEEKENLINSCTIFCTPSELEGLPITLLEAMSYSKVCLASDIPAHKEALGSDGSFFELNSELSLKNKLEDILSNYSDYKKIQELNYVRVKQNFTWDIVSDKYIAYCDSLLK